MFAIGNSSSVPQYLEAGNAVLGTSMVDDTQCLSHDTGPITRLVVYAKQFIWGMQVFYADGSTTGLHSGFMEAEANAECRELALASGEYIAQISGYAEDYIGVLHITTNYGKALDIGSTPLGTLFSLKAQGLVVNRIVCGYTRYLNYIGAYVMPNPVFSYSPSTSSSANSGLDNVNRNFSGAAYSNPSPQFEHSATLSIPPTQEVSAIPSSNDGIVVEFTAMYGSESSNSTAFNDYEEVVRPALKAGSKVKICRIKIYKKDKRILGIKPVYEVTDTGGNVRKEVRPHHGKSVGFFTSREVLNFKGSDFLSHITGRAKERITKIKIVSSNKMDVIEYGVNEGSEFLMIPKSGTGIIAIAGSFDDNLRTLRSYSLR
eukprot:TRINITY_DN9639_c0_g1_i2.p1 TRINITY_DN9639_c0_g1~~TRINITY_DN9639_c0_g1_i2.p1  ORF type:complete len:374 (-),score=34.21 TRINITY_DN9639_c0_g1_i2:102-1223(-)